MKAESDQLSIAESRFRVDFDNTIRLLGGVPFSSRLGYLHYSVDGVSRRFAGRTFHSDASGLIAKSWEITETLGALQVTDVVIENPYKPRRYQELATEADLWESIQQLERMRSSRMQH